MRTGKRAKIVYFGQQNFKYTTVPHHYVRWHFFVALRHQVSKYDPIYDTVRLNVTTSVRHSCSCVCFCAGGVFAVLLAGLIASIAVSMFEFHYYRKKMNRIDQVKTRGQPFVCQARYRNLVEKITTSSR